MSYDLMVFCPEAAPKTKPAFLVWYDRQTQWTEEHTYADPALTPPALRAWLQEMQQTFPDLNGPDATLEHTSEYATDYGIGRVVIYAAFSWALTAQAHELAQQLAQQYQVGFYDPSFESPILLPEDGELRPMNDRAAPDTDRPKPWWKWL